MKRNARSQPGTLLGNQPAASRLVKNCSRITEIFWMLLLANVMSVSSAYIRGSEFEKQLGKSLKYIIKRSGPRIVP